MKRNGNKHVKYEQKIILLWFKAKPILKAKML